MSRTLTPEITRFVLTSIPSVVYLEALLLLRAEPETEWTASDLARRLYVNEKAAPALIRQLVDSGIAEIVRAQTPLYRYRPVSVELSQRLDQLALAYVDNLLAVTRLIHSKSDRIAQQFADAFKWRKED